MRAAPACEAAALPPLSPLQRPAFGPGDWSWSIGLENFGEFDPCASLGSPRSLAALRSEGIEHAEILYRPLDHFQEPGLDPQVAQLRHDFFEARRQDLLALARRARAALLANEEGCGRQESEMEMVRRRLAGADFADCPRTSAFFRHWQAEFDASRRAERAVSRQGGRGGGPALTAHEAPSLDEPGFGRHLSDGEGPTSPSSAVSFGRSRRLQSALASLCSSASEPNLRDKLEELSVAPHGNHVDEELVRKTRNLLTQRKADALKQRGEREEELRTVQKVRLLEQASRARALEAEERSVHMKQYRAEKASLNENVRTQAFRTYRETVMAPEGFQSLLSPEGAQLMSILLPAMASKRDEPPRELEAPKLRSCPTGAEKHRHWEEHVRKSNVDRAVCEAQRQMELVESRVRKSNERRERVLLEKHARSLHFAQQRVQARITWRHGYSRVLEEKAAFEEGKAEKLAKKQARFAEWERQADDSGLMRRELRELRDVHRLLSQRTHQRKEEHWRLAGLKDGEL